MWRIGERPLEVVSLDGNTPAPYRKVSYCMASLLIDH